MAIIILLNKENFQKVIHLFLIIRQEDYSFVKLILILV